MEKVYFQEIDIIKGIAILLIIMGHCFCEFPINISESLAWLSPAIRCCPLAVFFMASGFLFSTNEDWATFFKKKSRRLLVPYIVFCCVTIALRIVFAKFTNSGAPSIPQALLFIATGQFYWFLYALFIIMVICRIIKQQSMLIAVAVVATLVFVMGFDAPLMIIRLLKFFPFFVLGMLTKRYYSQLKNFFAPIYLSIYLSIYLLIVYLCDMDYRIWDWLGNFTGCLYVWTLSVLLCKLNVSKLFSYFGRYSLQFYLNHLLIMLPIFYGAAKLPIPAILQWIFIFGCATSVSYIILLIEQRFKWLSPVCGLPHKS